MLSTEHDSFFAHSLQLVVHDGFRQAGQLSKLLSKASNIVSFVRKSTIATGILAGEKRLQAMNATRWNSQIKMIRSILEVPESKLKRIECPQLSAYDRNLFKDMLDIDTIRRSHRFG